MNKTEKYVLSEAWEKKLRNDLRSFRRTIYWGPFVFILLNTLFSFALQRGNNIGFWTLFIPITILSTIYCILFPQPAIRRYKNIIQTFERNSENEMRLGLIDGRIVMLSKPEIKDGFFKVGNSQKASKSIINESDKSDYTIIPDFFTDLPIL